MKVYEPPSMVFLGKIGDRARVAAVSTNSGWELAIDSTVTALGLRYTARLTSSDEECLYILVLWPSLEHVHESIAGYLTRDGHPHVATALRAAMEAEVRP